MNNNKENIIGAVIVAAGLSSRMGNYKPLMEIGGKSVARRVACALAAASTGPIVVVTGHRADELEAHLAECVELEPRLLFIRNEAYASTPMFESAKLGLMHIMGRCGRSFFCPIDVPLFTADTARALAASKSPIVKPVHKGEEGHPILIRAELIPELAKRGDADGMKGALSAFERVTELVEVADEGILYDADTPEQFKRLEKMASSRSNGSKL
ncbi:MAG: nucleotidyltransferase family protein [Clostridiales Family XIII bacterium]|jgi:CTP:molybdopterin cytidylyltransferase MocA|nr:nucleotidyltransferase family protein [Clostridiales Family XIII bacterium]